MRLHDTGSPFENAQKYEKDFVKWWRAHAVPKQSVTDEELYSKFSVHGNEKGELFINCGWNLNIQDHTITQLPFRFGKCAQVRFSMNKLASLEGAPKQCNLFALETLTDTGGGAIRGANNVLDNIKNGPESAEHMTYVLARPLQSLHNNLRGPIESLWIHAPSIRSFEGLNVHCHEASFDLPFQKSITGIHKQLKGVDNIALVLDPAFDGGLLSLAMVRGLKKIVRSDPSKAIGNAPPYEKAFAAINAGIVQGWNIHELQEKMIDAGLGKFARL